MTDSDIIAQAVSAFREAAIAKGSKGHRESPFDRDMHAAMAREVEVLRSMGAAGTEALWSLARDPDVEVRAWAATELLSRGETEALPIIEQLTNSPGLLSVASKLVLQQYRAGRLESPFAVVAP